MAPTAQQHLHRVVVRPTRANAHAALFPLRGAWFTARHRALHPLVASRAAPALVLSSIVLGVLFTWTYLPQVALLAAFHGRGSAWVHATVLVLGEAAAAVALLFEAFFVDATQADVFDAVLVARGHEDLVRAARDVRPPAAAAADPVARLGPGTAPPAGYAPFSLRQVAEFVVLLPLNLIPVFGLPVFLFLTGYRAGPLQHWRYFGLRGMDKRDRREWVARRRWEYTWFGTVYLVLQLVPVLSMVFLITSAAGSALWAAEMECERRAREDAAPAQYSDEIAHEDA